MIDKWLLERATLGLEEAIDCDSASPWSGPIWGTRLRFPICQDTYQHAGSYQHIPSHDTYEAGWGGRGDLVIVPVWGECEHRWEPVQRTTEPRKGAYEWYGIGLAAGPEGSPPEERFTERKSSKSLTNYHTANGTGEQSEPRINMNASKSGPRVGIEEKGSLRSLCSPGDEKCTHGYSGGRGCYLHDPTLRGGAA